MGKQRTVTGYYSDDTLDKQFRRIDVETLIRRDQSPGGHGGEEAAQQDWKEYFTGRRSKKGQ